MWCKRDEAGIVELVNHQLESWWGHGCRIRGGVFQRSIAPNGKDLFKNEIKLFLSRGRGCILYRKYGTVRNFFIYVIEQSV